MTRLPTVLTKLKQKQDEHSQIALPIFEEMRKHNEILTFDVYAISVFNRSCTLTSGFRSLIEIRSFSSAAALLRLQLDNILRFYALLLAANPHEFLKNVFEGGQISKFTDRSGVRMTDKHLVTTVSSDLPWIGTVYEKCSGYVHFSSNHFYSAMKKDESRRESDEHLPVVLAVGPAEDFISDRDYTELTETFIAATDALAGLIPIFVDFVRLVMNRSTKSNDSSPG